MSLHQLLREIVRVELKQLVREIVQQEKCQLHRPVSKRQREARGTYKGDSQAKKTARLRVWETAQEELGEEFVRGQHVFLASHEGGDASTLRGLGVPDEAMLAVDSDPAAIMEFERKYPGVASRNADVSLVLSEMERAPSSVFLDFSAQVSDHTLSKVRSALTKLKEGGVLACTFAIGREKHWNGNGEKPCEERIAIVEQFVQDQLGYKPLVLSRMRYTSESMTGPGSSLMFVVVFQMKTGREKESAKLREVNMHDLYRDVHRHRGNKNLRWLINCAEHKTEALRARVKDYPPPRVT